MIKLSYLMWILTLPMPKTTDYTADREYLHIVVSVHRLDPPGDRLPVLFSPKEDFNVCQHLPLVILQWVFWAENCLSVCQWGVWCRSAFVMVHCRASQTRTESQVHFHYLRTGGGNQCVWLILPDVSSVGGTEAPNLPKPCSTYLATSLYQGVNTSALHTKDTEQKKHKSWGTGVSVIQHSIFTDDWRKAGLSSMEWFWMK